MNSFSVLFVCLGNICRSPTAEGVFRTKAIAAGIESMLTIDSAGTSAYHIGETPDQRSQLQAKKMGYDLSYIRSRKLDPDDFEHYDLLIAMDWANYNELLDQACPSQEHKIKLFLQEFAPKAPKHEVPDPYYGGKKGFIEVIELIEQASDGLINYIRTRS